MRSTGCGRNEAHWVARVSCAAFGEPCMAKKDPPRPGARPRPSAKRPRAAGAGRSRPSRPTGNAPAAPAPTPKQASGGASWKPNQPDAAPAASELRMVPLTESDADDEGDGGAPKSATSFFALPTPRRKAPVEEPQAPPPSTVPTVGGPPPGMVPGPMGGPPPGMSMGISGPVASGPAGGPPGFTGGTGYGGGPATQHPADTGQERARSYRVFAIVGGLMMMVFMAVLVTLVMVVVVVSQQEDGSSAVVAPEAAPAVAVAVVDTGRTPCRSRVRATQANRRLVLRRGPRLHRLHRLRR